ncbi:conserved hypothetical protein [delta proteobacterium NaphS2]|nr:conserved hypothetical protein [delta proteobacterium NaphS2]
MDDILDYFLCDVCAGKDFKQVYNFGLRFHGVNFSDDLIYDEMVGARFQCTKCGKLFSKEEIDSGLTLLRKERIKRD